MSITVMNQQSIDSLAQVIRVLPIEEHVDLTEQFFDCAYPTPPELTGLALESGSFDFLFHEPDLYSLEDGEPVTVL
jgi:hypothetical protein